MHIWILLFGSGVHLHGLFHHNHSSEDHHGHLVVVHAHELHETAGQTPVIAPEKPQEHRHDVAMLHVNALVRPAVSERASQPGDPAIDPALTTSVETTRPGHGNCTVQSDQESPPPSPLPFSPRAGRAPPAA